MEIKCWDRNKQRLEDHNKIRIFVFAEYYFNLMISIKDVCHSSAGQLKSKHFHWIIISSRVSRVSNTCNMSLILMRMFV